MNNTFMFGEDRFGESENFYLQYSKTGGKLSPSEVNGIIRSTYNNLTLKYADEKYRENFPSLNSAMHEVADGKVADSDIENLIETFAFHELGHIPHKYVEILHLLSRNFVLAAVIDIWAPKRPWLQEFEKVGVLDLFTSISFSSDHGKVKPSPEPFEMVINQINIAKPDVMYIGDSVRRDLGGATNAGIDCILVGGENHPNAIANYSNLIELYEQIFK